jgi:hypothetical protein
MVTSAHCEPKPPGFEPNGRHIFLIVYHFYLFFVFLLVIDIIKMVLYKLFCKLLNLTFAKLINALVLTMLVVFTILPCHLVRDVQPCEGCILPHAQNHLNLFWFVNGGIP